MVDLGRLTQTEGGLVPDGEGWFVVNAREARWWHHDTFGSSCTFEGECREGGVVLRPAGPYGHPCTSMIVRPSSSA